MRSCFLIGLWQKVAEWNGGTLDRDIGMKLFVGGKELLEYGVLGGDTPIIHFGDRDFAIGCWRRAPTGGDKAKQEDESAPE